MRKQLSRFCLLVLAMLLSQAIGLSGAAAQQKFTGLKIRAVDNTDFVYEYTVNPGDSIAGRFLLQHDFEDQETSKTYYLLASDFSVDPDTGDPIYPDREFFLDSKYSFARYIQFNAESVTLDDPGEEIEVQFSAQVPRDMEPGTYFAALLLSNISSADYRTGRVDLGTTTGAGIGSRLAPVVLVTVRGQLNTTAALDGLDIVNDSGNPNAGNIHEYLPVTMRTVLSNNGNYVIKPAGNIFIHQGDLTQPVATFTFNSAGNRVLPETTRPYLDVWDESLLSYRTIEGDSGLGYVAITPDKSKNLRIGRYFATAQISYKDIDDNRQLLEVTKEFWIIPWKLIIALIIIAYLIFRTIRRRQRKSLSWIT